MIALGVAFVALIWFGVGYAVAQRQPTRVTVHVDGTKPTKEQTREIAAELRKVVRETLGPNARTADGWDLL